MLVLVATLGVSFSSALIPLINVEAYLGAVTATTDTVNLWALVLTAAVGQMAGKVLWYEAGRRSMEWSFIRKKMSAPKRQQQLELWRTRVQGRPAFSGALLFASALTGIPPYAVISVLAGQLRIPVALFVVTGLLGRTGRFAAVTYGVSMLPIG